MCYEHIAAVSNNGDFALLATTGCLCLRSLRGSVFVVTCLKELGERRSVSHFIAAWCIFPFMTNIRYL